MGGFEMDRKLPIWTNPLQINPHYSVFSEFSVVYTFFLKFRYWSELS